MWLIALSKFLAIINNNFSLSHEALCSCYYFSAYCCIVAMTHWYEPLNVTTVATQKECMLQDWSLSRLTIVSKYFIIIQLAIISHSLRQACMASYSYILQ